MPRRSPRWASPRSIARAREVAARAGLSLLRHRRARPGLRAGHRHAGDRRADHARGAGDPARAEGARHRRRRRRRGGAAVRRDDEHRPCRGADAVRDPEPDGVQPVGGRRDEPQPVRAAGRGLSRPTAARVFLETPDGTRAELRRAARPRRADRDAAEGGGRRAGRPGGGAGREVARGGRLYLACLQAGRGLRAAQHRPTPRRSSDYFLADAEPRVVVCDPDAEGALGPIASRRAGVALHARGGRRRAADRRGRRAAVGAGGGGARRRAIWRRSSTPRAPPGGPRARC